MIKNVSATAFSALAMFICVICSCSQLEEGIIEPLEEIETDDLTGDEVEGLVFSVLPYEYENEASTKATYNDSFNFMWEATDTIGIFPNKGSQVYFDMSSASGTSTATFEGGGWALKANSSYWSYCPLIGLFYLDKTAIPVKYKTLTQEGNDGKNHIWKNEFLYTSETAATSGSVNFSYHHLGCILSPSVTLPAGTYTKLTLSLDDPAFITEGTYDLTSASPSVTATSTSNTLELNLSGIAFSGDTQLDVHFMTPPVNLAGIPIKVTIYNGADALYCYYCTKSKAFQAGHWYGLPCSDLIAVASSASTANEAFANGATSVEFSETPAEDVNIVLPQTTDSTSIVFPSTESTATVTVDYAASGSQPEKIYVKAPENSYVVLNTPNSTVTLGEGTYGTVDSFTADNTLIIPEGTTIGTLNLGKGNVVVYGHVDSFVCTDTGNKSDVTVTVHGIVDSFVDEDGITIVDDRVDLSKNGTANCYIASAVGKYKFNGTVKGNSSESVGAPASAEVLWESFGTDVTPSVGDVVKNVSLSGNYVLFTSGQNGNAVIAVKDADGTILWSWHIWVCEGFDPVATQQVYNNNAGTLMDRNLGATSATPGDVHALGLLYQWGRKDPFLGSSSISQSILAESTHMWPSAVQSDSETGTINYATANPTTFIYTSSSHNDWEKTASEKWQEIKTIYDPCPAGWKIPDNKIIPIANGTNRIVNFDDFIWDTVHYGVNFGRSSQYQCGDYDSIWYPFAGQRSGASASLGGVGWEASSWSYNYGTGINSGSRGDMLGANHSWIILPVMFQGIDYAASVRCISEASPSIVVVENISLDITSITIGTGETSQLAATIAPSNANVQTVTWSSSDTGIATVSDSGLVTAVAEGTCTITAESYNGKTATCTVVGTASKPLTFTSTGATEISLCKTGTPYDITLEYKLNDGAWTCYTVGDAISLNDMDKVSFRAGTGGNSKFSVGYNDYFNFNISGAGTVAASGNIMSLIDQTMEAMTIPDEYFFYKLFAGSSLTTAPELPASTLAEHCYACMFANCTGLTTAPELPASTLAEHCYAFMFVNCTSLTTAPELPATSLARDCYLNMFEFCTGLTSAPELPATSLANGCYNLMFYHCSALTSAPELKATTLAFMCYGNMFEDCTSLTTAPALPATSLADLCYFSMFSGCTGLTEAPVLPATSLVGACYADMFRNCTSLMTAPALTAESLAGCCYEEMFYGCTSLTTAPELPATHLADGCYFRMFYGCEKLNYVKALFTTAPSDSYTINWLKNVSSTGIFVKSKDAIWDVTGANGIPDGWDVIYEPESVDLGLSVKWATCNIGADSPEEYGTYFAWGDVAGQTWDGSSWSGGGFNDSPAYELDDNNNLKPGYDAAHVNWGGTWRMPTHAEQDELIDNCTSTWTSNYNGTGVAGRIFTSNKEGYTDKSIFLPAAGLGNYSGRANAGSYGHYWSSTFGSGYEAWRLIFRSGDVNTYSYDRLYGQSVRPVCDK